MAPSINLRLEAPWDVVKEHLKENDIRLTEADLAYTPGKEEELLLRLEKIMGKSREQVIAYIESISAIEDLSG